MYAGIHDDVRPQLETLQIDKQRPLVITDADEVLFSFMAGLEAFLETRELYFDWTSFALTGNIRRIASNEAIEQQEVGRLLTDFFDERCASLAVVEGAAEGLASLSDHAQVVVLSNVPPKYAEQRRGSLLQGGMDFPLIANIGSKGEVVRFLTDGLDAPAFFIDDIPHNHRSVSTHAAHVQRLHYIADARLSKLLGPAEDCHVRLHSWPEISDHILRHIGTGLS